jgi:histone H4
MSSNTDVSSSVVPDSTPQGTVEATLPPSDVNMSDSVKVEQLSVSGAPSSSVPKTKKKSTKKTTSSTTSRRSLMHKTPDSAVELRKPSIRRLARRGGVKRLSGDTYESVRTIMKDYLKGVVRDALLVTRHAGRKTVTSEDVVFSMKQKRSMVYGI